MISRADTQPGSKMVPASRNPFPATFAIQPVLMWTTQIPQSTTLVALALAGARRSINSILLFSTHFSSASAEKWKTSEVCSHGFTAISWERAWNYQIYSLMWALLTLLNCGKVSALWSMYAVKITMKVCFSRIAFDPKSRFLGIGERHIVVTDLKTEV